MTDCNNIRSGTFGIRLRRNLRSTAEEVVSRALGNVRSPMGKVEKGENPIAKFHASLKSEIA